MPRLDYRIVLAVFAAVLLILIFTAIGIDDAENVAEAEWAILWIARGVGLLLAVVAAAGLLMVVLTEATVEGVASFATLLLAGLLLMERHWGVALALGAAVVAMILRGGVLPLRRPHDPSPVNVTFYQSLRQMSLAVATCWPLPELRRLGGFRLGPRVCF